MRSIYILFVLFLSLCINSHAQLGVFKYATFYGGVGLNNSLNEANTYTIQNNILTETSIDNKFNYRISYGFRRFRRRHTSELQSQ